MRSGSGASRACWGLWAVLGRRGLGRVSLGSFMLSKPLGRGRVGPNSLRAGLVLSTWFALWGTLGDRALFKKWKDDYKKKSVNSSAGGRRLRIGLLLGGGDARHLFLQ